VAASHRVRESIADHAPRGVSSVELHPDATREAPLLPEAGAKRAIRILFATSIANDRVRG
jgi:hypothetical protein